MEIIYNKSLEELENYFLSIGEKPYRGKQIFRSIYKDKVKSFNDITTIKKELREKLSHEFSFESLSLIKKEEDKDVKKYLFKTIYGDYIETVLMKQVYGYSLCVSSEVGCNMGCLFCKSGQLKRQRKLETYEMVTQVLEVEELENIKINSVVVMGIGEPFDNYDNTIKFLDIINNDLGLGIGARKLTVSTVGLVPKIYEYSNTKYNLAVSLHFSDDHKRSKYMPINKKYNLEELREGILYFNKKTKRKVTLEYIMLEGINDSVDDAYNLIKFTKGLNAYVNLIPYNKTDTMPFSRSSKDTVEKFYDILIKAKVRCVQRKEFGTKIDAACGQLSSEEE